MKKGLIFFLFLALSSLLYCMPLAYDAHPFNSNMKMPSLINMDQFDMSHSASFMAGGSSNGMGFYESRYTNHILYNISPKLKFRVDLNFINFGTASMSKSWDIESQNDNQSKVLPDFQLEFNPTENSRFIIEVNTSGRNSFGSYRRNWWY